MSQVVQYVPTHTVARMQTSPFHGPVGFLDITPLTLPPQRQPSQGFLSHCSMGKTHIFITAEPVAPHNLSLLAGSPLHRPVNHGDAVKLDLSLN